MFYCPHWLKVLTTPNTDVTVYWHPEVNATTQLQECEKLNQWRSAKTRLWAGVMPVFKISYFSWILFCSYKFVLLFHFFLLLFCLVLSSYLSLLAYYQTKHATDFWHKCEFLPFFWDQLIAQVNRAASLGIGCFCRAYTHAHSTHTVVRLPDWDWTWQSSLTFPATRRSPPWVFWLNGVVCVW